jgi:hypothetical protein
VSAGERGVENVDVVHNKWGIEVIWLGLRRG